MFFFFFIPQHLKTNFKSLFRHVVNIHRPTERYILMSKLSIKRSLTMKDARENQKNCRLWPATSSSHVQMRRKYRRFVDHYMKIKMMNTAIPCVLLRVLLFIYLQVFFFHHPPTCRVMQHARGTTRHRGTRVRTEMHSGSRVRSHDNHEIVTVVTFYPSRVSRAIQWVRRCR